MIDENFDKNLFSQDDFYEVLNSIGEVGSDFKTQQALQQSILDQIQNNGDETKNVLSFPYKLDFLDNDHLECCFSSLPVLLGRLRTTGTSDLPP